MKGYKDIEKSMKNLSKIGEELGQLKNSVPSMLDDMVKNAPKEDREKISEFVKGSNELMNKANKIDFAEMQKLTKEFINKWQKH